MPQPACPTTQPTNVPWVPPPEAGPFNAGGHANCCSESSHVTVEAGCVGKAQLLCLPSSCGQAYTAVGHVGGERLCALHVQPSLLQLPVRHGPWVASWRCALPPCGGVCRGHPAAQPVTAGEATPARAVSVCRAVCSGPPMAGWVWADPAVRQVGPCPLLQPVVPHQEARPAVFHPRPAPPGRRCPDLQPPQRRPLRLRHRLRRHRRRLLPRLLPRLLRHPVPRLERSTHPGLPLRFFRCSTR